MRVPLNGDEGLLTRLAQFVPRISNGYSLAAFIALLGSAVFPTIRLAALLLPVIIALAIGVFVVLLLWKLPWKAAFQRTPILAGIGFMLLALVPGGLVAFLIIWTFRQSGA